MGRELIGRHDELIIGVRNEELGVTHFFKLMGL
jgi:hypothetical protein